MKISFCITYYNQEQYVKDSIKSILSLEIPIDFEVLIGDDGSSDGTLKKIEEFKPFFGNRMKIYVMPRDDSIKHDPIIRSSANRLNLLKRASGDFVMFLDGDDYYCCTKFLKQAIEILMTHSHFVAIGFSYKKVFSNREQFLKNKPQQGIVKIKDYIKRFYIPSGAFVFRNIFNKEKLEMIERDKIFDDNLITIYILQFGKMYFCDKVIYAYRQTEKSSWNSYDELERNIFNALDYEFISRVAPSLKKSVLVRNFGSIKFIFKNRNTTALLLKNKKYETINNILPIVKNSKIYKIIYYKNLSLFDRVCMVIWFFSMSILKRFCG